MMTNEVEHEGTPRQLWLHVHVCVTHVSPDQWTWLSPPHSDTLTKHGAWAKPTGPTELTIPHGPLTTWLSNPTSSEIPILPVCELAPPRPATPAGSAHSLHAGSGHPNRHATGRPSGTPLQRQKPCPRCSLTMWHLQGEPTGGLDLNHSLQAEGSEPHTQPLITCILQLPHHWPVTSSPLPRAVGVTFLKWDLTVSLVHLTALRASPGPQDKTQGVRGVHQTHHGLDCSGPLPQTSIRIAAYEPALQPLPAPTCPGHPNMHTCSPLSWEAPCPCLLHPISTGPSRSCPST